MLTEDDVVRHVCVFLEGQGFRIDGRCSTSQPGVDIEASKGGDRLLVEAKGETSSKSHTSRYGRLFDNNQVLDHVAKALYTALKLKESQRCDVALAFPSNAAHHRRIDPIAASLADLGISVFWVDGAGAVVIQK